MAKRAVIFIIFAILFLFGAEKCSIAAAAVYEKTNVESQMMVGQKEISPYVKHGKYYYAHGYKLVKKLSKFKKTTTNKFVGS